MAIGGGVAMNSTASAMPWAIDSMPCTPTVSGVNITVRGDGGAVYTSVNAEAVVADAGAAEEMLDARPMATAAINAITAPPRDRVARSTGESSRKSRPEYSRIAEATTAQARSAGLGTLIGHTGVGLLSTFSALIRSWVAWS